MIRDATNSSNGYYYQRLYGVYIFLKESFVNIIEEGQIDGKNYEDITIKNSKNEIITYQIKLHKNKETFTRSSDIFKTLANFNNISALNIYYIVGGGKDEQFDENFKIWKEYGNIDNVEKIYEKIKNFGDEIKNTSYNIVKKKFDNEDKNESIKYLLKYRIEEGYNYKELIEKINYQIAEQFKNSDKDKIQYVRYLILDLFTENSFNGNKSTINREISIKKIEDKIGNDKFQEEIYDIQKKLITEMNKKNIAEDDYENIFKDFRKNYNDIDKCLNILNFYHDLYVCKNDNNIDNKAKIKKEYGELCKKLCENIIITIKNTKKEIIESNIKELAKSLHYYYSHNIDNKIDLKSSGVNCLLKKIPVRKIKNKKSVTIKKIQTKNIIVKSRHKKNNLCDLGDGLDNILKTKKKLKK